MAPGYICSMERKGARHEVTAMEKARQSQGHRQGDHVLSSNARNKIRASSCSSQVLRCLEKEDGQQDWGQCKGDLRLSRDT